MKSIILLLRIVLASAGLIFMGRVIFLLLKKLREAAIYADYAYYDPTIFVVMGLLLLPVAVLVLRYLVQFFRKNVNRQ